ncbi:MAG: hypothetical protein KF703_00390 [Actinobacteria bacterium]|nr:hypothetical protein [Actinomycetota bacterium]
MTGRRLLAVALAAAVLVGCGGSSGESPAEATTTIPGTSSSTSTSTTTAGAEPIDPGNPLLSGLVAAREQVADPANAERVAAALDELDAATGIAWTPDMLAVLGASYCNDWDRPAGEVGLELTEAGRADWAAAVGPLLSLSADQAAASVRTDAGVDFRVCQ